MAAQLFEEGRALLEQGHADQACPKLEESQRLDPGGGTLLNVALCHERAGRTATAWVEFVEARGIAKADDRPARVAFAQTHIAQLEPSLSRIVVQVPPASDVPDLEIKRDGSVVGRAAWNSAVPVDPGDHVVEASAPGKFPWRQSVVVGASADTRTVMVPPLQDASGPVSAAPSERPFVGTGSAASDTEPVGTAVNESSGSGSSGLTVASWIALGVGAAGAGAATYFGLHAMSLKSDADRECPGNACSAQGASDNHDAITYANFATAAAAVGVVGVGAGLVLLVVNGRTGKARSSTAALDYEVSGGAGHGEVTLRGRW